MELYIFWLFIAVYLDVVIFKKRDLGFYKEVFKPSVWKTVFSLILMVMVLMISNDPLGDIPSLLLVLFLPMYLLKRSRFVKLVPWREGQGILVILSSALGVIIVWTYGVIAFGFFTMGITVLFDGIISEMGDLVLTAMFSSFLVLSLVYQASRRFSDQGFLTNVGLRIGERSKTKTILLPIILGIGFALYSAYLGVSRPVQPQTPLNDVLETTQSAGLITIFFFLAICIAPLIEEIVFRGYFFRVLKTWIGNRKAIYIIGLTFAFLHVGQYWGDWLAIMVVTALGMTLTILRAWTGSTVSSTVMHYVYNGFVTVFPVVIMVFTNPAYLEYRVNFPYHDAQTKESLLRESIAKQPDLADAYNDLAWLYAQEEKNLGEALGLVEKALSYSPEYEAYLDTKAEVLEKLGRDDEAKAIREKLKKK